MKTSRIILFTIVLLAAGSLLSSCIGAGAATTVQIWPGLTVDEQNQLGYVAYGNAVHSIDLTDGSENWRFPAEAERNLGFSAPPAMTDDGNLVAGAYNKTVYSINAERGQQNWINADATNRYYAGALYANQKNYVPNIDHSLYVVDDEGELAWKFETGGPLWSTPVTDGKAIYLTGMDHKVYALNPDNGQVIWQTDDLGGSIAGNPALSADGRLYFGTYNNEMLALDSANGKVIWRVPVSGWVHGGPLLKDGVLYFGDLEGTFYALDAVDGKPKWPAQPETIKYGEISGTPAIIEETVYFGTSDGVLFALDITDGKERWNSLQKPWGAENNKSTLGKLYGPTLTMGDTLLITPMGNGPLVIAIDALGNQKWSYSPAK